MSMRLRDAPLACKSALNCRFFFTLDSFFEGGTLDLLSHHGPQELFSFRLFLGL